MSPDGKYLFGASSEWICRYTLIEGRIAAAEHGRAWAVDHIVVSPDSNSSACPARGNKRPAPATGTAVYSVTTFAKTESALDGGAYPRPSLRPGGELIYLNGSHSLIVFTEAGSRRRNTRSVDKSTDPRQFLGSPDVSKLLMLTGSSCTTSSCRRSNAAWAPAFRFLGAGA